MTENIEAMIIEYELECKEIERLYKEFKEYEMKDILFVENIINSYLE